MYLKEFMLIFFLSFLMLHTQAAPRQDVTTAKKSIEALIKPLIPHRAKENLNSKEKFRTDLCEKHKINWMNVLLKKEEAKLTYHFKEGCDIQGTIIPQIIESFPAELAIKNVPDFNHIKSINEIIPSLELKPILNLKMDQGILTGPKGLVKFSATYSVRINTTSKTKILDENLGGEIYISEIFGQKTSIREKIIID